MKLKKDSTAEKLRGAYYTPTQLADAMVAIIGSEDINHILEPSCGDGVFLESLASDGLLSRAQSVTAIEIDRNESEKTNVRFIDYPNVNVLCDDFFNFYKLVHNNIRYDLIIGNPPYIRYQYLTETQRELQSMILTTHGMKSNKLINSWVCFLVACIHMLADGGHIAFVIPAEIMQVAYAEDLRLFMTNRLSKITLITFEKLIFPEIEQEVCVLIGKKGGEEKGIRIIEMDTLEDFDTLDLKKNVFQKVYNVKEKWTSYFVSAREAEFIQTLRTDDRFTPFKEYGIINVGITTGNNNYFSITEDTETKYELKSVTLPLIGRSSHAHGICFTKADWLSNKNAGKKAMLVSFPDNSYEEYPAKHKEYIRLGEEFNQHSGYKCTIRDRWYIVPSVWVPDAFFLRRNNIYPKFVLNQCEAVSTDTMHRMKFYIDVDPFNVLLSYYNSISFAFAEICGRSYGGGVLEILPGEMGNILLPKVSGINPTKRNSLLNRVDIIVREDTDIEQALDIVDKELLVDILGIDAECCQQFRQIWRKLKRRRLGRS